MPKDQRKIPDALRYFLIAVDRVGFPIVAFLLIFYLCFVTLKENTRVLGEVNKTLECLQFEMESTNGHHHGN